MKWKNIVKKIREHPVVDKYMTDAVYHTRISLCLSLGVNLLFVAVNILSYLLYNSMWFIVLAIYYMILAIMRFLLVRYVRKVGIGVDRLGELKSTILCSSILLTVNFALSGAVLMILYQDRGFEYHGVLIYVVAMYTFYITVNAIIDLVKYRKYDSPVMMTAKVISMSAALVSMLALETAMLSQFGRDMLPRDRWLMVALTGAGVSISVVTMAIYMIVRSVKEKRRIKENGKR